jgi:hypothetical protein
MERATEHVDPIDQARTRPAEQVRIVHEDPISAHSRQVVPTRQFPKRDGVWRILSAQNTFISRG